MPTNYRAISGHVTGEAPQRQIKWASEEQQQLFNWGPEPICASGGYGSGKTAGFCLKILWLLDKFPGNRGVVFRKHFEDLKKTTMATFFKFCPPDAYSQGGKRADSEKILQLNPVLCPDGRVRRSELLWMHMDDPETENVINGLEINFFLGDQAEEIQEDIFEKLMGRLGRWDDVWVPPELVEFERKQGREWEYKNPETGQLLPPTYAMLTVNPDTELHWVYQRFHPDSEEHSKPRSSEEGALGQSYKDQGYTMVFMDSTKNRYLTDHNKRQMLSNDPTFVRRYVRGQWGIPEGIIHNVSKHSLVPATLDMVKWVVTHCRLHRYLDHGDSAPTCCLWAGSDADGNLIFYREYYRPLALISQHRKSITEMSRLPMEGGTIFVERYDSELADPAIFLKTMQKYGGRWSVADEYMDTVNLPLEDSILWQPGDNNEFGTRNRINEYLRVDPDHINPFTKERGAPHLYLLQATAEWPQGCRYSIKHLCSQRRVKIGSQLGRPQFSDERDPKVPDHAYDPIRYGVAGRPANYVSPEPPQDPMSFSRIRQETIEAQRSGGFSMQPRDWWRNR